MNLRQPATETFPSASFAHAPPGAGRGRSAPRATLSAPGRTVDRMVGRAFRVAMGVLLLLLTLPPLLAAPGAGTGPGALQAQQALTLDEAIELALAYNPGFQITQNEAATADWEVRAARGSLFLPNLGASTGFSWQGSGEERIGGLTAGELGVSGQPSLLFSNYSVGVNYSLSGAALRAPALARASRDATLARGDRAQADLILRVTQAWLDFARQAETREVAERQLSRAQANLDLARGMEAVGSATPLEAMQAEIQVERARIALMEADQGSRTSRLALLRAVGLDRDRNIAPGTLPPIAPLGWSEEELLAAALASNPDLANLRATAAVARERVGTARAAYYPSLQLSAGWSGFTRQTRSDAFLVSQLERQSEQAISQCEFQNEIFRRLAEPFPPEDCSRLAVTPDQISGALDRNRQFPFQFTRQPPSASLSLSIPIFQGVERRRQLEVARLEEDNARLRLQETEQGLLSDIAALMASVRTARALAELEGRNREVAEAQLRLARGEFEVGTGTFLRVAEAESDAAQADREHLEAIFRYHDAVARLEGLVGMRLRGR